MLSKNHKTLFRCFKRHVRVSENAVFDQEKTKFQEPINAPPGLHFLRSQLYSYKVGGATVDGRILFPPKRQVAFESSLWRLYTGGFNSIFPPCDWSVALIRQYAHALLTVAMTKKWAHSCRSKLRSPKKKTIQHLNRVGNYGIRVLSSFHSNEDDSF